MCGVFVLPQLSWAVCNRHGVETIQMYRLLVHCQLNVKDIPAEHPCTAEVRMCSRSSSASLEPNFGVWFFRKQEDNLRLPGVFFGAGFGFVAKRPRRLKDDKCLSEANCKGSGQSEGKMSSVGCALQNIELCEFDV